MRQITLNRQLLGLEDLLFGTGTVTQNRANQVVTITEINAGNLPFDETRTLVEFAQDTNIEELGNSIEAINNLNNNLDKLLIVEDNLTEVVSVAQNIVQNLTEILNVDTLASQVTQDKSDVSTMKLAVETIYDTFDDRFLGTKTVEPTLDNDGNALIDGAMYFDTTSNTMKVYDVGTTTWYSIPQIYLSALLDVDLTSITSGNVLRWNGTKWINYALSKSDVGLNLVNNTSDLNKPVSTAVQTALELKAPLTSAALVNPTINGITQSGYSGFKNYIINGKKVINQRVLTSTDNSYNQDRWYKSGVNWYQGIEGDNNLISDKTYTLSWVGTATASYYVGTATSATINAQSFTSIINGDSFTLTITLGQNLWIKFASDATGSTFNFVQLEEGSVATPFENRPYGLELSLCQRYLPYFNIGLSCLGQAYGVNLAGYTVKLPVSTRVAPTGIVSSGSFTASRGDGAATPIVSFSFATASKETVAFNANLGVSFLTSGQASHLVSTGGILYFTGCEL